MIWEIGRNFLIYIIILNTIGAFITLFREKRDITSTWAWSLVLIFLPIIGFIAYAFLGRKLPRKRLAKFKSQEQLKTKGVLSAGERFSSVGRFNPTEKHIATMFKNTGNTQLTVNNQIRIYTDGCELFQVMIDDFNQATVSIYVEFYAFLNDQIGNSILHILEQRAKAGIEVRVIYDFLGSSGTKLHFFDHLRELGGFATPFLGVHSNFRDFRLNFRNHRKIVIIDDSIGYIGGFNVGDQYLGKSRRFGYWRDTHLRIVGDSIQEMRECFVRDWNTTTVINKIRQKNNYFPTNRNAGNSKLQIVSSGPDSEMEKIKFGYLKLINSAQKRIWIQTPYLIPDDSILDALHIAALSGVDVRIMIPNMPDHAFVYCATQYYAAQLANQGIHIYFYQNGFIHAKTMVIDGQIASVGSANMDFRSFKLNFEISTFIYDEKISRKLENLFISDMDVSEVVTPERFKEQSAWLHFKQSFSRLLSPIL